MELIIDNGYSRAEYYPDLKVIYTYSKGLVNVELGKEAMLAQQKHGLEHGLEGIVVDFSELKGTFTSVNEWTEKVFFPPLLDNGLKCTAMVVSPDVFAHFAIKDIVKKMGSFEIQIFKDLDSAWEWVKERIKQ